ncbi:MAG: hypothetical protein R3270_10545 [Gammaproteobacteria bacterium]|nr:hypothetical protein [Gammaproteobacteria bacterium]
METGSVDGRHWVAAMDTLEYLINAAGREMPGGRFFSVMAGGSATAQGITDEGL